MPQCSICGREIPIDQEMAALHQVLETIELLEGPIFGPAEYQHILCQEMQKHANDPQPVSRPARKAHRETVWSGD